MRKLKTPEEIIKSNDIGNIAYALNTKMSTGLVKGLIIAAQRDALECAAENAIVANGSYDDGEGYGEYVDKSSILNLMPKEK